MADPKQVQGLPEGATLKPIQGLPAGASLKPIQQGSAPAAGQNSAPSGQQDQPGFFKRGAQALGLPTSMEDLIPSSVGEAVKRIPSLGSYVYNTAESAVGAAKKGYAEAKDAGRNIREGGPVMANVGKAAAGMLPFVAATTPAGHVLENFGTDVQNKNYSGAAGGATGLLAQVALPGAAEKVPLPTKLGMVRKLNDFALNNEAPEQILTRALKPPVTYPEFEGVVKNRLPEISQKASGGIKGVDDFTHTVDALREEKSSRYQGLRKPHESIPINASPVANAQVPSIPATDLVENPNIVAKTSKVADNYRKPMPLGQLDDIREDTNAKLNSFYQKNGGDKHAALSNPETARVKSVNDTSRDLVYDKLKELTGTDPAPIQDAYGDYRDIGTVSGKRGTVFGRQNPVALQEAINTGNGLANGNLKGFVVGKALKQFNDSNYLTRAAMDKFDPSHLGPSIATPGADAAAPGLSLPPMFNVRRKNQTGDEQPQP